ncbi:MAG: molybdenum cofactor guanylyltransferase [Candidatus Eisenbacteria bacterium]|nr:molybdenum cofactor guanylyltransferase [Candidatus Eisenbacteria bacterium]
MEGWLGIVLAGGAGRRLALGAPKAMAQLEGRTLVSRAIERLREVCRDVVVSVSPDRPLPPGILCGARAVSDPPGAEGPLAGLVAGLSSAPFEAAIVLGVDFPLVSAATLASLAARLPGVRAVIPAPHGRPQPLVAVYAADALAPLRAKLTAGERAVVPAVMALDPLVIGDAELGWLPGGIECWLNVNTAQDLAEAASRLHGSHPERAA